MDFSHYKTKPIKSVYAQKLNSSFMLGNKYIIDPEINQASQLKIKFISHISYELEALIQKISFSCAGCGGPDKARITIEISLTNHDGKWFINDIKACTIAYKSYTTPWRAIKPEMFTLELEQWTTEVLELLLED